MSVDAIVIAVSVVVFSALAGIVVRRVAVARGRAREAANADDVLARAAKAANADLPGFLRRIVTGRRVAQLRIELPDALDMVANSLTAGLTLPQALLRNLDHFPPVVQEEFARVIYDTRIGYSVAEAFGNLAARLDSKDVQIVSIATRIGVEHGGNLADGYRMLSGILRDKRAFEMELAAMTTEGRMQALVMTVLPVVLMLLLGAIRKDFIVPMVTTAAGWGTLGVLACMQTLAYLWIRKIVDIKV